MPASRRVFAWMEAPYAPAQPGSATFVEHAGLVQPAPAPRFSQNSPAEIFERTGSPVSSSNDWLTEWGFSETEIAQSVSAGTP